MNIPDVFQESYDSWYKKYIEETEDWVSEVNKNPFIAIESHIHEDTITDLLAHILQNDKEIKKQFITFLLNKAKDNGTIKSIKKITDTDLRNTEIETQYSIKVTKSRLDLFIKIPNKYHIIIESKIFGAKEQPDQMKRYIEGAKGTVLAFYATSDGQGECKTARNNIVIPLAFYSDSDDPKEQTIYSVLLDVKDYHPLQELTQDFCFYLRYRFFNQQSVSFLQKLINNYKIDLCSHFEELFKEREYPSISKNINPYACPKDINPYEYPKNYFMQLLKVHALNRYLLKKFENDNYSYHSVFDGIRVKRRAKIGNTNCNVYFETKYYKTDFFMVITICSLNEIYEKIMELLKGDSDYWYKEQNKLNKEFTYSLWLWIMDPKDIEKRKDSILNLCKNYENYENYIEFIFTNCMKEIFDAITEKKEIDKEALEHYKNYYHSFQQ